MIDRAIEELRKGRPILVFDSEGREGETDIVVASQFVTPELIRFMRREGGGLICATIPEEHASRIGLPYLHEIFKRSGFEIFQYLTPEVRYDKEPAFSITINHRSNFTGISDRERARTVRELTRFLEELDSKEEPAREFGREFISPGHVHLLISKGLERRKGHTELTTALMFMARLIPSATIVEMLGDHGRSLSKEEAKVFARENNLVFVEGKEIEEAWKEW